ncbi:MAG: hypothetical protein CME06_11860 [Gemmatimonadetes bacterium]|nr:hypothetical protein [Gemmatimonadota bacterium]
MTRADAWPLISVLLLGLALRWTGIRAAFDHPDELHLHSRIEYLLESGSLDPHYEGSELGHYPWGTFPIYIYSFGRILLSPLFGEEEISGHRPWNDRSWSGLFGVATVLLVYMLGHRAGGRGVGILAATAICIAPLHVQISHYLTPDALGTLLLCTALLTADIARRDHHHRIALLGGSSLAAGLAVACKYTFFSGLLAPVAAAWSGSGSRCARLAIVAAVSATGFLIGEPYALFDLSGFWHHLTIEGRAYTGHIGQAMAVGGRSHLFYLFYLARSGLGPLLALACTAGVAHLLLSTPRPYTRARTWIWAGPPLLHLGFVGSFPLQYDRNVLPLLPPLAVAAAVGIVVLGGGRHFPGPGLRGWAIALGVLAPTLAASIVLDLAIRRPHPRDEANWWLQTRGPDSGQVHSETYSNPLSVGEMIAAGYRYALTDGRYERPLRSHPERYPAVVEVLAELREGARVAKIWRNPILDNDWLVPAWLEHGATLPDYHGSRVTLWELPGETSGENR